MTVLTMRYLRGHFVVTGPDIEPLKFKSRRPLARPNSVCVRDGLAGWGGGIRISAFRNRNSPRLSAWGLRDSNLKHMAKVCSVAALVLLP
jgi:hypothetical protein